MAKSEQLMRLRPTARIKRVLCVFLAIIFAFSALSMAATAVFFRWILPNTGSETSLLATRYAELDQSAYPRREVHFSSECGTLRGYLYGEDNPNGIVLFAHGMNSNADRHLPEALYFVERGWCVFLFDGTATSTASGSSANFLLQMKQDVLDALQWLLAQPTLSEKPIVLCGHSLGAYAVAAAAAEAPSVRAVVCLAGFNSPAELMYSFMEERAGVLASVEYPFLWLYNRLAFGQAAEITAVQCINALSVPVLVVQGSDDEVLPWELTIMAHSAELTNPLAQCLLIDEPGRNGHSSLWLSAEAGSYAAQTVDALNALHEEHGSSLSPKLRQSFLATVDKAKLNELDKPFMAQLHDFFLNAVTAPAASDAPAAAQRQP